MPQRSGAGHHDHVTSSVDDAGSVPYEGAPVRIACVDDDTLIREGIAHLLPGVQVAAAFRTVEGLLVQRPDAEVVLLDLWLRGANDRYSGRQGIAAIREVVDAGYRVLIYTNEGRREVLAACLAAGAHGVIHKSEPLGALVAAVQGVARDEIVVTTALAGLAEVLQRRASMPSLSPRQLEVLRGRARGEPFKSIAARMYLSPKTVEEYMAEVNRKFAAYLRDHSPADLERLLGVGPGDLLSED